MTSHPNPPKPPMVTCPHCDSKNEADRQRCRNCHKPLRPKSKAVRICRTPEEAFRAGWQDAEQDPPLTEQQVYRLAALLTPHIRPLALKDVA